MLHYQGVLRCWVFQGGDWLGEVWARDLYLIDFIEVCLLNRMVFFRVYLILGVATLRANDYSRNWGVTSEWKALLLNKVVVGHGKKLTRDDKSLAGPPPGYDSVSIATDAFTEPTDQGSGSWGSRREPELR